MNRAFAAGLADIPQSLGLPVVIILAVAAVFALISIVALLRAERSFANGALAVVALLAVALAAALALDGSSRKGPAASSETFAGPASPALTCLDELAGEIVGTGCEQAVFASAESTAAAVSYTASQISRLAAHGDAASADRAMTPSLQALRRAIERDRYGLVAHVLAVREGCKLSECAFFTSLTNTAQIANNMNERVYESLVARHAPLWGKLGQQPGVLPPAAAVVPTEPERPTGKPVSGDFPSSASIPPISIMAPEPPTASTPSAAPVPSAAPARPAEASHPAHQAPKAAAKKPPAAPPAPPRSLTPPAAATPDAGNNR